MTIWRVVLIFILAAFLGSCTTATSLPMAQEEASTKMVQTKITYAAKMKSKVKTSTSKQLALKQKPAGASSTADEERESETTPNVGSPEWKREQAENERKEEQIKKVIQGICRGC